jgi:predicted nucleotidyltransferase
VTSAADTHRAMIELVARALGDDLLGRMVFLGGSATGLLITDDLTRESIRHTEDVDLIVEAVSHGEWARLRAELSDRGFRESPADDIICRMRLGAALIVDFMPTDERILGFTNRWYQHALHSAEPYLLAPDLMIRLVTPVMFVATKLEAYRGRGNDDPLTSRDLEDLINLVDGRADLIDQVSNAVLDARAFIAAQIAALLQDRRFEDAVQGNVRNPDRESLVFERLDAIAGLAGA